MPKLKPETVEARRAQILDAAEACFLRSGFHQTTIQDISSAAGLSAGALYAHFESKEDLICGLAERESAAFADRLAHAAAGSANLLAALEDVAEHYTVHEPRDKNRLFMEIGTEATRNPKIAETFAALHQTIHHRLTEQITAAADAGQIAPDAPPETVARVIAVVGDGLCWRRAHDPECDPAALLPAVVAMLASLIKPVGEVEAGFRTGKPQAIKPSGADAGAHTPKFQEHQR